MSVRDIFLATCVVLGVLLGVYLIYRLSNLVIVLFVAVIFASTVRPLLRRLVRYRVPRVLAIPIIYLAALAVIVGLITLALPPVVSLTMDIFQDNELISDLNYSLMRTGLLLQRQFEVYIPVMALPERFSDFTEMADETLRENALPVASNTAAVIGQIFLAIVISIYWLTARSQALKAVLRATPRRIQPMVAQIWIDSEEMLGSYFRSQLLLGFVVGLAAFTGLLILRVPNALALAVVAGLLEFVPFVGPIVAAVPAVIMGLTISPLIAVLVAVLYFVIQTLEGNYLIPKIMGSSLSMHPLLVLIAIVAGMQLNGIVGAILAVPIAALLQVLMRHLPAPEVDVPDARVLNVNARDLSTAVKQESTEDEENVNAEKQGSDAELSDLAPETR